MENKVHSEYQYLNLIKDILENGNDKELFFTPEVLQQYKDKGETPPFIRSVFGRQIRFDLSQGFPLLTTKKVFIRGIIHELLWFIKGESNIKYLIDNDVHIWDEWAYKKYLAKMQKGEVEKMDQKQFSQRIKDNNDFAKQRGDIGNVYGVQRRKWIASDGRKIDQLARALNELRTTPLRKSIVVSARNPEFIYEMAASKDKSMAVAPCHTIFQFNVNNGKLSLQLYQRSGDLFLGVPFNIASYALFTMMIAQICGFELGEFVHTFGDVHLYSNHFDQAKEQFLRSPKLFPKMIINKDIKNIDDFKYDDFKLEGYDPHGLLKGEIANIGGF